EKLRTQLFGRPASPVCSCAAPALSLSQRGHGRRSAESGGASPPGFGAPAPKRWFPSGRAPYASTPGKAHGKGNSGRNEGGGSLGRVLFFAGRVAVVGEEVAQGATGSGREALLG